MSTLEFDSEISDELTAKYDTQSSIGADIVGGVVATVADFGASVWNSLTPKSMETSTEDLLSNIDSNALRVYNENPDLIKTASFVGGIFVPTGLALKGMSLARSGMKGVNWFSEAGQVAQKTKVAEAFANAGIASSTYKKSLSGLYAMSAANVLVDTVAAEAAMVITMNAHPYMEDYMKDLPSNFMTSVGLGLGVGAGIGHILDRAAIKGIKTGIEQEAMDVARKGYSDVSTIENIAGQMSQRARNVENWENILASAKPVSDQAGAVGPVRDLNNFTKNMLETFVMKEKASIVEDFERMASPEIRNLDEVKRSNIINMITNNPERFSGIDNIRFASAAEDLPANTKVPKNLVESTKIKPGKLGEKDKDLELPLTEKNKKGEDVGITMVYSPKFDSFMLSSDLKHYGTAVDLIQDEAKLTAGLQNNWHLIPRYDQTLEASRMTTSAVDADYLKALKYYDELPIENFLKGSIAVSPDDTAVLQAIHARISKEVQADPALLGQLKVTLTKEMPNFDLSGTQIIEKVITNTITKTIQPGVGGTIKQGISKNALNDMVNLLRGPTKDSMDLMYARNSLSQESRSLMTSFSEDQMWLLHNGLEIYKRKNQIPQGLMSEMQLLKYGSENYKRARANGMSHKEAYDLYKHETSQLGDYVKEILNSPERKKLIAELSKHADSEGYIYLYRGMRGKAAGHSPGESYTPDYKVALSFAGGDPNNVGLYRVHPDEIVGYLGRFGGSSTGGEAEIVLDVPTRIVAGKPQVITGTQQSGNTVTEVLTGQDIKTVIHKTAGKEESAVDAMGVYSKLMDTKQNQLDSFLAQGVPPETISLHTNIPLETIEAYMVSPTKDLSVLGLPTSTYSSASEIGKYMDTSNRSLVINTNLNKVPTARLKNTIQKRIFDSIDMDVKSAMLAGSTSEISRDISSYLRSDNVAAQLNVLTAEINKVTDSGVGGKMFTSTDFALRDLGAVGAIASAIGKDTQELINKAVNKIWEPMKPSFTSISKDPAAIVELNTAMKVNASLQGYREFRGNKFFQQDPNNPWRQVVDPKTGKVLGKERNMVEVTYQGKTLEIQTPAVQEALTNMQNAGRELYEMRNSLNKITGRPPVNDLGFWSPPFNPRNKLITYVWDKVEDKTTLLFGKNAEELQTAVNAWKSKVPAGDIGRRYELVDKSNQALYNKIQGRHDNVFMSAADSDMLHSGSSASEIVSTNADILVDLANGYDHYVGYGVRSMLDVQLSDVMQKMDQLSYLSQQSYRDQPLNLIQKMIQKPKDPGAIMRNTLMGNSNLDQSIFWEKLSDVAGGTAEFGLTTINKVMEPVLNKAKGIFGKGKGASDQDYMNLIKELDARGIPNPFKDMDDHLAKEMFHVQSISQAPNMTPRILALSNSLAATTMLKFMELAQPYVNAISLPILTAGAMGRKMEKAFMGATLDESAKFGVAATMYNGVRFGGTAEGKVLNKMAEEAGLFKSIVSEATEVMGQARSLDKGVITAVERGLEVVNKSILSRPAEYSETLVRKLAFQTGAYMAKESYPGISKAGIMTFARDFMDQAIGNYSSAQRPVMFQGTLGVAMGLFQTYMLTTAQDIYRLVENRNFKQLGKMMLAQGTIFGARSLPGFNYVSEMIGEHFSDQNIDLTTGLYRALPPGLADYVVYGIPSNLGPAITTRGEIQPRVPNILGEGINAIPAINMLKQAYQAGDRIASAAFTADASTGRAMLEALSLQSISRPIARMSEMLTGNAITGAGNLVSGPDDVWTWRSAGARAMATRPLEEVKAREAIHLNSFYGSLDREKRQEVVKSLRTHIRDNNLTPDIVEKLGNEYMRTGSASGWRSAVNTAIAQVQTTSGNTVRNYLKPNSPFFQMIDDLE